MRIENLEYFPIAIDRDEIFKIATGEALTAENVIVKITGEGEVGWGNANPNNVTEETTESIIKALDFMKGEIEGEDIEIENFWTDMREKIPSDRSALAGVDIALYDLKGKLEGKKIYEMFDGVEKGVLTDRTIGIMGNSETVEHAQEYLKQGFKALKIKIGLDLTNDIRRITAVREAVGPDIKMWVDANQGYKVNQAIRLCEEIEPVDIEFIEQPVKDYDLQGLKRVSSESNIPIMADEAIKDHQMAEKICRNELADMVNIKLMKSSGITGGRKIVDVLETYGVNAMVGCMGETVVSIAAGVNLYLSSHNIRYADLDSHFMLTEDVANGLDFKEGKLWLDDKPGLGLEIDENKIHKYLRDI